MDWDSIIEGRVVLLSDFNAYSLDRNVHYSKISDAMELGRLVNTHNLILNNKSGNATGPTRRKTTTIINFKFITTDIGALDILVMDDEISTPSDHEIIFRDLADPDGLTSSMGTS